MKRPENGAARFALIALVVCYTAFTLAIVFLNPPWEAPDEADHVHNVETLVDGHWFRIESGAGLEPHQPPLYYLLLAGWQRLTGERARVPHAVRVGSAVVCIEPDGHGVIFSPARQGQPLACAKYRHDLPQESADDRLAHLLRLPSVLFGCAILLLTAAVARRTSTDPWTPFAAAAFVAGVPGFAFTSAIVNNDGLVTLGATLTLFIAVVFVQRAPATSRSWPYAVLAGALVGLLLLTKLYGPAIVIGLGVSLWLATRGAPRRWLLRFDFTLIAAGVALITTAWWLIQNQRWYGDPVAATRSHDYLLPLHGLGAPRHYGAVRILFVDVPSRLYNLFFDNSTVGHLLWIPLVGSVCCLALPGARRNRPQLVLLGSFVVSGLVALCIVALQTKTFRASTAYIGLSAFAVLAAMGIERLRVPVVVRLLVPLSLCAATLAILGPDLVALYRN